MIFDRMCSLWEPNDSIDKGAGDNTESRYIDLRLNRGLDEHAKVCVIAKGNPSATTTIRVETSDGSSVWDVVGTFKPKGKVWAFRLPSGIKRYFKCYLQVGTTAITGDFKLKGGLVDQFDEGFENIALQEFDKATGKWFDVASDSEVTMK